MAEHSEKSRDESELLANPPGNRNEELAELRAAVTKIKRRLPVYTVGIVLLFGITDVAGRLVLHSLAPPVIWTKTLVAEEIRIRKKGNPSELALQFHPQDGKPNITFSNNGVSRMTIGLNADGSPVLGFRDPEGHERLSLGSTYDPMYGRDAPKITLMDDQGRVRISMKVQGDEFGSPVLAFLDPEGKRRLQLDSIRDTRSGLGRTGLQLLDERERPRLSLDAGARGDPCISLMDDEGRPRLSFDVGRTGDDKARFMISDPQGQKGIRLEVPKESDPEMKIWGRKWGQAGKSVIPGSD